MTNHSLKISQTGAALVGAIALTLICALILRLGDLGTYCVEAIALGLAAGIVYLTALWALANSAERRWAFWVILGGALLCRALLLPLEPKLSNDVHRYRWDAKVQEAGGNPYTIRPDDPRLAPLRDQYWSQTPGRDISTIYPPLMEFSYRGILKYFQSPMGFKVAFAGTEILLLLLMAAWTGTNSTRNFRLAIYAWNPLVLVEYAGSGHNDALAMIGVVGALWLWQRKRLVLSSICLAAAMLLKIFPVVLFPALLFTAGWPTTASRSRKWEGWTCAAVAMIAAAACAWPFRSAWPVILDSFAYYEKNWKQNNASLWALLEWCSGSRELATGVGIGVVAALAIWLTVRRAEPVRAAIHLFGGILLLSQNAFPWYFTWMAPLLAMGDMNVKAGQILRLRSGRGPAIPIAWLLLTVTPFLSYHVLIEYQAFGVWHFRPEMLWLEYGPFFALALWKTLQPQMNTGKH